MMVAAAGLTQNLRVTRNKDLEGEAGGAGAEMELGSMKW